MKSRGVTEFELFAKHQNKFQELVNVISSRSDGGIEIMYFIQADAHLPSRCNHLTLTPLLD